LSNQPASAAWKEIGNDVSGQCFLIENYVILLIIYDRDQESPDGNYAFHGQQ